MYGVRHHAATAADGQSDMKRHLLIIAIFLLLGAVVNVAVAWGCAVWFEPPVPASSGSLR